MNCVPVEIIINVGIMTIFSAGVIKRMTKNEILDEVVHKYLNSRDFNGLPVYSMKNYSEQLLCELIDEGQIEILSQYDVINPHIKGFPITASKETQKKNVHSPSNYAVIYPTATSLQGVEFDHSMPYSSLMRKGSPQFDVIYFNIEILERYVNNPKFQILDGGYRGSIYPRDEYIEDRSIEGEYIRDYGMAYINGDTFQRAIGVFVFDLAKLTPQKQMMWKGFELESQDGCTVNSGFVKNLILGEWVTEAWVFHAVIDEINVINDMCEAIGIPHMFNHTFSTDYYGMPEGYRNILLPTRKNYHDFVLVLEKMLVHNISYKAFVSKGKNTKSIERYDEKNNEKGTLLMLQEWLCNNTTVPGDNIQNIIIAPLKQIRKIRQAPAHELSPNEYDIGYYTQQFELINSAYYALDGIRMLLAKNPATKDVNIPQYLIDGTVITNY